MWWPKSIKYTGESWSYDPYAQFMAHPYHTHSTKSWVWKCAGYNVKQWMAMLGLCGAIVRRKLTNKAPGAEAQCCNKCLSYQNLTTISYHQTSDRGWGKMSRREMNPNQAGMTGLNQLCCICMASFLTKNIMTCNDYGIDCVF